MPREDRLELFGFDDADDAAYDASPDADADADAACDAPLWRSSRRRRRGGGFRGFVLSRRERSGARARRRRRRVRVRVRVRRRRRRRGGGDGAPGAAALEHLVVSVFAPPRTDALDPPLGPRLGATTCPRPPRDFLRAPARASMTRRASTFSAPSAPPAVRAHRAAYRSRRRASSTSRRSSPGGARRVLWRRAPPTPSCASSPARRARRRRRRPTRRVGDVRRSS